MLGSLHIFVTWFWGQSYQSQFIYFHWGNVFNCMEFPNKILEVFTMSVQKPRSQNILELVMALIIRKEG